MKYYIQYQKSKGMSIQIKEAEVRPTLLVMEFSPFSHALRLFQRVFLLPIKLNVLYEWCEARSYGFYAIKYY